MDGNSYSEDGNLGAKSSGQSTMTNKKLQQAQAEVEGVIGIIRNNIENIVDRDSKLSELDNRADALEMGAAQFESSASQLKKKYWWNNLKTMVFTGVICVIILIIITASAWPSSDEKP